MAEIEGLGNVETPYEGVTPQMGGVAEEIGATGVTNQAGIAGDGTGTDEEFRVIKNDLPAKTGFWSKVKSVLFKEIKVELTPYQQKVEDEINEFLHQEITWSKVKSFLFKEIKF